MQRSKGQGSFGAKATSEKKYLCKGCNRKRKASAFKKIGDDKSSTPICNKCNSKHYEDK